MHFWFVVGGKSSLLGSHCGEKYDLPMKMMNSSLGQMHDISSFTQERELDLRDTAPKENPSSYVSPQLLYHKTNTFN